MPARVFDFILGKKHDYTKREVHNIADLYNICCSKEKNETYNDVMIDDILVDSQNVEKYQNGIKGCRIAEASIGEKVEREAAYIMSCPAGDSPKYKVKIIFENKKSAVRLYYKLTDATRTQPIIIAGDWEPTPDATEYQSQCIIHRAKQIYFVNE